MKSFFQTWKVDLPSGLVVFLVALPLCLGIGLASTTIDNIAGLPNIFAGLIAGIVGGIVVGFISKSNLGVSGPAAGLITIVITSILTLGSYQAFLVAVIISGIIQVIASYLKAGIIAGYIPSSVIKGMLAAIGITLILKEIPHLVGYDADFIGDESFVQKDGHNTITELFYSLKGLQKGSLIIGFISLILLLIFDLNIIKSNKYFKNIPGALVVVITSVLINNLFISQFPQITVFDKHLVQIPVISSLDKIGSLIVFPDFSFLTNHKIYVIAFTLAIVGSLETLLSVEATDKLDPDKNLTPTNRELFAQGIGNIVSGFIGGLPITQVIVRSSANINSGAKSKLSTIVHGLLLVITILYIPNLLNQIPLAALGAILIMVGYKLAKISLFKEMYRLGNNQFLPFITTIVGVLFTDLLKGICIGLVVSVFFILRRNFKNNFSINNTDEKITHIELSEEVTFLNKVGLQEILTNTPKNSTLIIDGTNCKNIDYDVKELLHEFSNYGAKNRSINLKLINITLSK
jgi:carbonic anhydrase